MGGVEVYLTISLVPRPHPAFFNVCTRKVGGPGIRSDVQYVTVRRVVEGWKLSVGRQKVGDFQSAAAHNRCEVRLYSVWSTIILDSKGACLEWTDIQNSLSFKPTFWVCSITQLWRRSRDFWYQAPLLFSCIRWKSWVWPGDEAIWRFGERYATLWLVLTCRHIFGWAKFRGSSSSEW